MKLTYRLFEVLFSAVCLSLLVVPVKLAIADAQSKRIGIEYELPKNPAHQSLYDDPVLFADAVEKEYLPKERARLCRGQYGELTYAFHQLIVPHLDRQLAKQVMDKSWLPADVMPSGAQKPN